MLGTVVGVLCASACTDRVLRDGGSGIDIGCLPIVVDCEPFDAVGVGGCDTAPGWKWDGVDCVLVEGCECRGPDCCRLFGTYDDCVEEAGACWEVMFCERCPEGTLCVQQCHGPGLCDAPTCQACTSCPCTCPDDPLWSCEPGLEADDYVSVDLTCRAVL